MQDVMTLYAEGYSLAELLVQQGGKARYLKFINDGEKGRGGWEKAIQAHYGYRGVEDLEKQWHEWIIAGSPDRTLPDGQLLAQVGKDSRGKPGAGVQIRGQSPDAEPVMGDPFLDTAVASARSPGINQQKVGAPPQGATPSAGERAAPREPTAKSAPSLKRFDRDWTPEEDDEASTTSTEAELDGDDGIWIDVPRTRSRPARRNAPDRSSASSTSSAAEATRTAESRPASSKALPSVVRQQQARGRQAAEIVEPTTPRERTPWSEFPTEGLRGFGGARD
jgi:hypothetical protein